MPHPLLPKLKDEHNVTSFDASGKWSVRVASELERLSQGLAVEKQIKAEINSIPDMWARPLLFEMGLYRIEKTHQLHKTIVGEWRGLLAMLALKEVMSIQKLTAKSVDMPSTNDTNENTPHFLQALAKLTPSKSISSDTSWNDLYVFLYDNKPIGMTSPTTLVVTATEYFGRIDLHRVPWFDGKHLTDPVNLLPATQKAYLAGWLDKVKTKLTDWQHINRTLSEWDSLLGHLGKFISDLGTIGQVDLSDRGLNLQKGIFRHLDKPVKANRIPTSHVKLVSSRAQPAPTKEILVVDTRIAGQWGVHERDIHVLGDITLQTAIPFEGLRNKNELAGGPVGENFEVWNPDWFFKEKLYVVERKEAFPNAAGYGNVHTPLTYRNQPVTPILPLDKALIDQLTVEDLSQRISFEQHDEGILVKLRLQLSGMDGQGQSFDIEHLYSRDKTEVIENVPVLEVWPDFKASAWNWKAYYTYYDNSLFTDTFRAKPYTPGSNDEPKDISSTITITRTDHYPEAMLCSTDQESDIGFLLVKQPEKELTKTESPFKVGVDFGATGTNVYYRKGTDTPQPFESQERYVSITASGRRDAIYPNFLPPQNEQMPFLSIFRTFPHAPQQNIKPLLDGIVYFPREGTNANDPFIHYNLKWSGQQNDTFKSQAFLGQLCLQVAAEAVNVGASQIDWVYSFPTAFDAIRRQAFDLAWRQIVNDCQQLTGVESNNAPTHKTESIAAACYFRDPSGHNAPTSLGAVCIDIGGSTSDIAIWQDNNLLWQTSLRLAGRDIFLDVLYADPTPLSQIINGLNLQPLREAISSSNKSGFYAQADALLRKEGHNLLNNLLHFQGEIKHLKQILALGLAGVFYYTGLVISYLKEKEEYNGDDMPSFFVGGNGSRMFYWLNMGQPLNSEALINNLFKAVFLKGSGQNQQTNLSFRVETSKKPKAEAAHGLICDFNLQASALINGNSVLAGEQFHKGGDVKTWDTLITENDFRDGLKSTNELPKLKEFLIEFNKQAPNAGIEKIVSNDSEIDVLISRVKERLANHLSSVNQPNADVQAEPIFILALKSLLEITI